ncbi:MAG: Rrf2 family transcriptional regulator [Candidatus Krumholzibacteria bacterium]|nr:Rrf2 family transcriptional regulator [Candidatus Krumholzibacteria bacterium]
MHHVLRISEAANLALHTMVLLAGAGDKRLSVKQIAEVMCASGAHLAKVLQRLAHAGLVDSARGPRGGFMLARRADEITLLEVLETMDGPFEPQDCLMGGHTCGEFGCLFGDLLTDMNERIREYLGGRNLEDVKWVYGSPRDRKVWFHEAQDHTHR